MQVPEALAVPRELQVPASECWQVAPTNPELQVQLPDDPDSTKSPLPLQPPSSTNAVTLLTLASVQPLSCASKTEQGVAKGNDREEQTQTANDDRDAAVSECAGILHNANPAQRGDQYT